MTIKIYRKQVYGKTNFYIEDTEIAKIVKTLTGRTTVLPTDLKALVQLGHEVTEVLPSDEPKLTDFL